MEPPYLPLFAELGAILSSTESKQAKSAEVLNRLRVVVPYVAGSISAARSGSVEHISLANVGYSAPVERHLNHWFVRNDPAYLLMRRSAGPPLRWRDNPFRYRDTFSAQEVFIPAGFDEGVTVCMHNRRGLYTGSLHLSVADRRHPTDDAVRFLAHLQVMLGELTDLGTPAPEVLPDVIPEDNKVTVTPSGCSRRTAVRPVAHALIRQVRAMAAADALPSWFWWQSCCGEVRLVTTERIGEEITVGETIAELPYGLSVRELEVLTLVARGITNLQIARRLSISPKTVAKHVEHTLAKLGAGSRTEAAVRATRVGLLLRSAVLTDP
jgi:DNA-binding CsgD family transcriptional regulator